MYWKTALFICFLPLVSMIYSAEVGLYGVDAGKEVTHAAGWWGLFFLTLSLSATPALRILKSRILMQYRRQLGLWTLFYSLVHLSFYISFLLPSWHGLIADIVKRPYITVGFAALLILIPLGITSTKSWQKRLKKNWLRLHKAVYAVPVLVALHWFMTLRSDYAEWLMWMAPVMGLLSWRLYKRYKK